ncbi:MAG: VanZ family protein, partial [Gammaproteobacteria bacterium]|nr:VanZ family protein [Gammaproteobacteria bacterium]
MPRRKPPTTLKRHYLRPILTFIYMVLVVYGSLYPWKGWTWPADAHWWGLIEGQTRYVSTNDITLNILLYIPIGLTLYWSIRERTEVFAAAGWSLLAGFALSGCMEFTQLFLPSRIASFRDLALNGLGTLIGITIAWATGPSTRLGQRLLEWRQRGFMLGRFTDFGLFVLAVWMFAQLSPFVPDFQDRAYLNSLSALWHALVHPLALDPRLWLPASFQFIGLGFILYHLWRPPTPAHPMIRFGIFALGVLLLKMAVVHYEVNAEAFIGLSIALSVLSLSMHYTPSVQARLAIFSLLVGYILAHLTPHKQIVLVANSFNWEPFRYQMAGDTGGLTTLLDGLWPFMGISYCTLLLPGTRTRLVATLGAALIVLITLSVEWW